MLEQTGQSSDLVEIAKRNGDFRRNYGIIIGAFLYLRSLSVVRGRSFFWFGLLLVASSILAWLEKVGWLRQLLPG
jgi:hypothetical protein